MPYTGSFEQKKPSSSGSPFLGFQEVAMTDVVDKSKDYPNMDMFLEISFRNGNSQFPTNYSLLGTFERDEQGNIAGDSSLLKRIIHFTTALGWRGGVDKQGNWVDEEDKAIDDIAGFLNVKYTQANYGTEGDFNHPYLIYVYKKWNDKANKAYTTVLPKISHANAAGRKDLESYVAWMKTNGYLKEHTEEQPVMAQGDVSSTATQTSMPKF